MNNLRESAGAIITAVAKMATKDDSVAGGKKTTAVTKPGPDTNGKPGSDAHGKPGADANGKTAVQKAVNGSPSSPADQDPPAQKKTAIELAVDAGWTMALLFEHLQPASGPSSTVSDRLPTEHELAPNQRTQLEGKRINALLARLGALLSETPDPKPGVPHVTLSAGSPAAAGAGALNPADLIQLNQDILEWLACAGREYGIAYQLGRSLRDTANPPLRLNGERSKADTTEITNRISQLAPKGASADQQKDAEDQSNREFAAKEALIKQLSRARVAKIQEWLSTLTPDLPDDAAAIVGASIGRWADLTSTIFDSNSPGRLRRSQSALEVAGELTRSLLPQGDAWINLLVGAESSVGLLTPEAFVAAGEAALNRTARILWKIASRYWYALGILAIAVAAALFFAARDVGGAAKVWTQIGTVAAALGITAKGIGTAMARLSAGAEKPIYGLEKVDAMAWSVTTIPDDLKLTNGGVNALRRSGITARTPMGRS
jgi:hypothetical protein